MSNDTSIPEPGAFDYVEFAVLPEETWAHYIHRVFPNLAAAMYDEPTTLRDDNIFRLGIESAFIRETFDRQTLRLCRTAQQIIDEFLAGFDWDGPTEGGRSSGQA
jgi:hypothetical protein